MAETKQFFLGEIDDKIADKYQYPPALRGEWVLSYRKQAIDEVWTKVCKLYHDEQLDGIEFLKTTTAKINDSPKDSDFVTISFICGPVDDLELVRKYGTNLLKSLQPIGPFDDEAIRYLASDATTPPGATSTNNDCAFLCQIEIPEEMRSANCLSASEPVLTTRNDPVGCPTAETEEFFLFEFDLDTQEKYNYDPSESGKWMLFYENKSMNDRWAEACSLYREGELTGVSSMKVSTAKYSPRQSSDTKGVIIFYCGPSSDEDLMKSYGKCILEKMHLFGPFDMDHMPYKTDVQTALGTRATGNKNNSIYSLPIPVDWRSENCEVSVWNSNISSDDLPSQVLDKAFLLERHESINSKWSCDHSLIGHWLMVFEEAWLDRAWKKAQDLYRAGKLTGIQSMSVSTKKLMNERRGDLRRSGFINCFCGPMDDVDLVMTSGENLVQLMNYRHKSGTLLFKYRKETHLRIELSNYCHQTTPNRNPCTSSGSCASNDVRSWRVPNRNLSTSSESGASNDVRSWRVPNRNLSTSSESGASNDVRSWRTQ